MQNSPASCAWYLPWTLAAQQHQQKLLQTMQSPFLDKLGAASVGGGMFAAQPQMQQQLSPNTAAAPPANYQQPALHPSAAPGAHFSMGSPYNLAPQLLNASQAQGYAGQLNPTQQSHLMHSAMFSSLPMGAYYSPNAGAGHAAFGGVPLPTAAQQSLLAAAAAAGGAPGLGQQTPTSVPVQMPVQMTQRAPSAPCVQPLVQPLNCLPQELNHLSSAINLNLSNVVGLRNPAPPLSSIQILPGAEVPINKKVSSCLPVCLVLIEKPADCVQTKVKTYLLSNQKNYNTYTEETGVI